MHICRKHWPSLPLGAQVAAATNVKSTVLPQFWPTMALSARTPTRVDTPLASLSRQTLGVASNSQCVAVPD